MVRTRTKLISAQESLARALRDPEFRDEWARTAVARGGSERPGQVPRRARSHADAAGQTAGDGADPDRPAGAGGAHALFRNAAAF